jgi:hypothetical protein
LRLANVTCFFHFDFSFSSRVEVGRFRQGRREGKDFCYLLRSFFPSPHLPVPLVGDALDHDLLAAHLGKRERERACVESEREIGGREVEKEREREKTRARARESEMVFFGSA